MYGLRVILLVPLFALPLLAQDVDFVDISDDEPQTRLVELIIPSQGRIQRSSENLGAASLRVKRQFDYYDEALQVAESRHTRQNRRRQNFRNQYPGSFGGPGGFGGPSGFGGGGFQGGFPSNQFSSSNANANSQGFNAGGFGGSSAAANANSQGQYFGPNGFGSSAANAQSQAFNSQGPLGGFGASAANTQTQAFNVGPNGIQGSAALAGSQAYQLPGGQSLNVAYSNGFSIGPDGKPVVSNGNSISYTG